MFRIGDRMIRVTASRFLQSQSKSGNSKVALLPPKINNSRLLSTNAEAAKAARIARMQNKASGGASGAGSGRGSGNQFSPKFVLTLLGVVGTTCAIYELNTNKTGPLYHLYEGSPLQQLVNWIVENTWGNFKEVFYPANDKLLPDWPTAPCYGNPFPGTPAPPVLVISLEKCLVGSVYDAKHGWRYVKRPGADRFLAELQNYYEIVLFSEQDRNNVVEVFEALDRAGSCHKFGSSEGEIRDGVTLKRLDIMNRNEAGILLIDPSPEASKLFPRNTLLIKPFEDIYDTSDHALLDLIPLLQGFVHEDVKDFRAALDKIGTHNAAEAVEEYEARIVKKKSQELEKRNRGIGGMIRTQLVSSGPDVSKQDAQKALPGAFKTEKDKEREEAQANPGSRKKGLFFQMLDESERVKDEAKKKKNDKMNEIYGQRMREKAVEKERSDKQKARERENDENYRL